MSVKANPFYYLSILGVLGVTFAAGISPAVRARSDVKNQLARTTSGQRRLREVKTGKQFMHGEAIREVFYTELPAGGPSESHRSGATKQFAHARMVQSTEGTVKFYSDTKGYGFITSDRGEDVYVHYSAIKAVGFRTLKAGMRVSFEISGPQKARLAQNVAPMEK